VYEGITAEDVRQAAATVLRVSNRTVGVLEPKPADAPAPDGTVAAAGGAR
jgi:predicted Zn-dependent peptidase